MSGGGGGNSVGHGTAPGPWANGAYFAPPPSLHADPNSYINRLLAYGQAPTIPDTFSSGTDGHHGGGHGKKRDWFKIALGVAAAFFGFSVLRGRVKPGTLQQQGGKLWDRITKAFAKKPTP